ncbi:MAG: VOC family protein [Caldilineaceae bacterium]|nr:VOC family protein [Caldilineaceae bacterium]
METTSRIDPETRMGAVTLTVADLTRSLRFYQDQIGLTLVSQEVSTARLGAGDNPLLCLQQLPGARAFPRATGLFHFALRVPSRLELARTLNHLLEAETPIDGASDHNVSEALYLHDPDGHGIEIYRDRPRKEWYDTAGRFVLNTTPFDVDGVMAELEGNEQPWQGIHPETDMGHVHLRVADLTGARHFYVDILGFEIMLAMDSALFISAGGYHHHLGMNTWAGVGVPAPPDNTARLITYEIHLPDADALSATLERLRNAGVEPIQTGDGWLIHDPSQNGILLV